MAVHADMQKMMPKFTESSTETSVVAIHTTKAAAAYLAARLMLLRERVGSVEKVGVEPDPKRVGPASWNLEYG